MKLDKSPSFIKGVVSGEVYGIGEPDFTKVLVHSGKVIVLRDSIYSGEVPYRAEFNYSDLETMKELVDNAYKAIDDVYQMYLNEKRQ